VSPDDIAAELLEHVGHVHVAATPEGWHCFTVTVRGPGDDDVEVLCGHGAMIAEALEAVQAQTVVMEPPPDQCPTSASAATSLSLENRRDMQSLNPNVADNREILRLEVADNVTREVIRDITSAT
jgi:hypothetical protein